MTAGEWLELQKLLSKVHAINIYTYIYIYMCGFPCGALGKGYIYAYLLVQFYYILASSRSSCRRWCPARRSALTLWPLQLLILPLHLLPVHLLPLHLLPQGGHWCQWAQMSSKNHLRPRSSSDI